VKYLAGPQKAKVECYAPHNTRAGWQYAREHEHAQKNALVVVHVAGNRLGCYAVNKIPAQTLFFVDVFVNRDCARARACRCSFRVRTNTRGATSLSNHATGAWAVNGQVALTAVLRYR
jgi:hypothetical protein